ncbi:MAG: hypothetical protein ACJAX8_001984, partial [Flavobacteriales bacterium]
HERRMFPRAELVATTFDRGWFLSLWKKLVATTFDRGWFLSLWKEKTSLRNQTPQSSVYK